MIRSRIPFQKSSLAVALVVAVLTTACAQTESDSTAAGAGAASNTATRNTSSYTPSVGQQGKDVVWVPTPQALVDTMLKMAEVTPDDYLVDLGSGDGRTVITAAQRGLRAHGIEYNGEMVELARRAAAQAGVSDRATFEQADIFKSDFSNANVVTLFLLSSLNLKLRPTLLDMEPGTRVLSNTFNMGDWRPDETVRLNPSDDCTSYCTAHKWIVPAKVEGVWSMDGGTLRLRQQFQDVTGEYLPAGGGAAYAVTEGVLSGPQISFMIDGRQFVGEVSGAAMKSTQTGAGAQQWSAARQGV